MTRMASAIVGVAVLLQCGVAAAEPNPQGRPKRMEAGQSQRWFVWQDAEGWHVRATTRGRKHHFEGTIRVLGGTIRGVNGAKLERKGKGKDWWTLADGNRALMLNLTTDGGMDGFDFIVSSGADEVVFDLKIDGESRAEDIHVGKAGGHPDRARFSVPAHP